MMLGEQLSGVPLYHPEQASLEGGVKMSFATKTLVLNQASTPFLFACPRRVQLVRNLLNKGVFELVSLDKVRNTCQCRKNAHHESTHEKNNRYVIGTTRGHPRIETDVPTKIHSVHMGALVTTHLTEVISTIPSLYCTGGFILWSTDDTISSVPG